LKVISAILLILFFAVYNLKADLLPDGKKKVSYSFTISNLDKYPDYVFLAYPVNQSGGAPMIECEELKQGQQLHLACRYGEPVIYAILKTEFNRSDIFSEEKTNSRDYENKLSEYFSGNKNLIPSIRISCSRYADSDVKYDSEQELFKIEDIRKDTMIVSREKSVYKDRNDNIIDESYNNRDDNQNGSGSKLKYLYFSIPLLSLVFIAAVIIIRKQRK